MNVEFLADWKAFRLETEHSVYLMQIGKAGDLRHVYYGPPVARDHALFDLSSRIERAFSPYPEGLSPAESPDLAPLEISGFGCGDYRNGAVTFEKENGNCATSLVYDSHRIVSGKPSLPGLPASFAENGAARTLEIRMRDLFSGVRVVLSYSVFGNSDLIARSIRVENTTKQRIVIRKLMSAQLDFHTGNFELLSLHGHWGNERNFVRRKLERGATVIRSLRGMSGSHSTPAFALASPGTSEENGEVYGVMLLYSGSFHAEIELDPYFSLRAAIGLEPENFFWNLDPGESFQAPEALILYSNRGLGEFSRSCHRFLRDHLIRSPWKNRRIPVLLNSWEALYFDFNESDLLRTAREAAALGMELFVLDDGWFGKRNDARSSLGDWRVNPEKIRDLGSLSRRIHEEKMMFGLWIEPEMISVDSDLYRQHPDWVLQVPGAPRSLCRDQLVLDLARAEVVDFLFESISSLLHSARIEYVKWDCNRNLTEVFSSAYPARRQGEICHRYMLGVYELLERILAAFPGLLLESCSGGGGRFDAGMLYYSPQIWCSDNTDAVSRIPIQLGTSLFYPVSSMGAHVAASPNHQTRREIPWELRGALALSGSFGYELDPSHLSPEEKRTVRAQIVCFRKYAELIRCGNFQRLDETFGANDIAAWGWVAENQDEALFFLVRKTALPWWYGPRTVLRFRGLNPDKEYCLESSGEIIHGSTLMNAGFLLLNFGWECECKSFYFRAVREISSGKNAALLSPEVPTSAGIRRM